MGEESSHLVSVGGRDDVLCPVARAERFVSACIFAGVVVVQR